MVFAQVGLKKEHRTFSLFDVGRSFFKQTPYGINATCEHLQINLALLVGGVHA
jgi:hypothetical protein